MILIEFLLAPTVPSAPRPKNTARTTSGGSMSSSRSQSSDRPVTSSTMPTVKWRRGRALDSSSYTPTTIAGVNSFEERPYRPPVTSGSIEVRPSSRASRSAERTSV
jgi:hypothetical protein